MKKKSYILLACSLLALTACEKEVEFQAPDVEAASNVTLNAIAAVGEPLRVYLNKAYTVGQTPQINIGYQYAFSKNDALGDYQTKTYYKRTAIFDAEVRAVVNGQQTYNLTLADDSLGYLCDYRPKVGDHIEVLAGDVHVETTVPPSPQIEILNHEVLAENPYRYVEGGTRYETDSIMRITCRIPATSTVQYYRLRVRGERKITTATIWSSPFSMDSTKYAYYSMQDIYFSEDDLFSDNRLTEGFGGWPAYFSDVFDHTKMGNGNYTFTIDSPKPPASSVAYDLQSGFISIAMIEQLDEPDVPARVMVELQAISPEFYHYLKSVELYRVTKSDVFSEPVQIYSNVQNGWGIFGALSYVRHFVEYGE